MKKALFGNKNTSLTLLEYRNTSVANNIPSPAQLLFDRKLKGQSPMSENQLKPQINGDLTKITEN